MLLLEIIELEYIYQFLCVYIVYQSEILRLCFKSFSSKWDILLNAAKLLNLRATLNGTTTY